MERAREPVAFLDTHVVVWLYDALKTRFGVEARRLINRYELRFSPMVRLELAYLWEVKRVKAQPHEVTSGLATTLGLQEESDVEWSCIVDRAAGLTWTRDPFDRLITAHAACLSAPLLTADTTILRNYDAALAPAD